jgi:large subunit ribosomal protein L4
MKTTVYNQKAEAVGEIELNPSIFEVKPNIHLLAEAVRVIQFNARQGGGHTKTRGDVSGGGKKPWKQKGTGRARAGSTRSPIWRHGGVTFGPRSDRNWELKMNKKAKTKALFMSLSDKAKHNLLIIVEKIELPAAKTKEFSKMLEGFKKSIKDMGKKPLFLIPKKDDSLMRASRNLKAVTPRIASTVSVLDVMKADTVILLKDSLPVIEKTYLKEKPAKLKVKDAK